MTEPDGQLRQLAVAHVDPAKVEWARELGRKYPPDPDDPRGVPGVIRTGEPEFIPEVTDELVAQAARGPEHLAVLRGLGLKSVMIVPLAARGRTLGAITFVAAEAGRRYARTDLDLALDLGRRAGLAVDNARLFRESQESLRLLGLLVEAAGRLTGTLDPAAVRAAVLDLSQPADRGRRVRHLAARPGRGRAVHRRVGRAVRRLRPRLPAGCPGGRDRRGPADRRRGRAGRHASGPTAGPPTRPKGSRRCWPSPCGPTGR